MLPSATVENYLKAIYLRGATGTRPHGLLPMGQLASSLGVTPGTATTMVKTLADSGLVAYEPYAGVALTPAGERLAALVLRRHRLVELFLVRVMGYSWDEVHDEAEQLEHVVSDRLIDRIDEMLGRPETDPHGDPIPNSEGLVKIEEAQTLLTCPMNTRVTVTRIIDQDKAFLRFVEGQQLKPGESIEVEERDAASDSVRVRGKNDQRITIGTRAASKLLVVARVLLLVVLTAASAAAQTTATLTGRIVDPQGGLLPGATVVLTHAVRGFERRVTTGDDATFSISNVPLQSYTLTVEFPGFKPFTRSVELRSAVPVNLDIALDLAPQTDTVTVVSTDPTALIDQTLTGTRTALGRALIEQLPSPIGSRGIESVLVTFPGFAQNANGAIHPRGAHNQMTYVVDGLAISDQLTGAFANALDSSMVQNVELMTGNIPAEFGAKISGVAVVTTQSGLGLQRRLTGDTTMAFGQFRTVQNTTQAGGQREGFGYFGSLTLMRTDRFLDQVSLDNLHNTGGFGRAFGRVDRVLGGSDLVRVHAMGGRSAFDLANLRSQEANGQDQRQVLADWSAWVSHVHNVDTSATLESTLGFRTTTADLLPSAGDTPVTAAQTRRLSSFSAGTRYTYLKGRHNVRLGGDVQWFPVREHFTFGITDATFNIPGTSRFNEALLPHDLTRGGDAFVFAAERSGTMASAFIQDTIRWSALTASLGLRFDEYRFIVNGRQLQPRVGVAWALPSNTVLRASYNRNYQTPPNENLLLSSSVEGSRLAPQSVRDALGGAYVPLQPERQDVVEAGVQQALFGTLSLDVSAYRKWSRDQQDNNNFFDTGIIFPTTLKRIEAWGIESRLTLPTWRRLSGTLSLTTARAVSTPPFTGGLFLGQDAVDLLSAGPFVIDHDQKLSIHATGTYRTPSRIWFGGSVRYDSGLVANPSDPIAVAADPDFADLLPYVDLRADVPRVRPRTITDAVIGYDGYRDGRRRWSAQLQVNNVTNQTALYNFQSVFVGTRVVQPRTVSAKLRYYW
jgi:Mn-dependent DtxR family transcriptional regulator